MNLARELAESVGAPPEDRQDMIEAAMLIGQWLADQGRPGDWAAIDAAAVLECASLRDPMRKGRFLFAFAGLVGHAGVSEQIPGNAAATCLRDIAALADHPVIARFARKIATSLTTPVC